MALLTRVDLQQLAIMRLDDAKTLLANERYSAAYYLVGYSVECALKACIAKQTQEFEFPDRDRANKSWTHELRKLVIAAAIPAAADFQHDRMLETNWEYLSNKWSESKRYSVVSAGEAHAIVLAVDDQDHGVLKWLQRYW